MTDEPIPAPEAGEEVVQPDAIEAEAAEAPESTEGQDESQPAEDDAEGEPKAETEEQKSKSQERRERRKAELERIRQSQIDAEAQAKEAQERLKAYQEASQNLSEPKQSDFPDFDKYQAALSAFYMMRGFDGREAARLESEAKARFEKVQQAKQEQAQEAAQNWAAQISEAQQKYPDFDQVARNPNLPISPALAEQITGSDVAGDLAYYLGKNPEQAARLSSLPPVEMARAIGRIEQQVSAPQPKTVSTAPQPISPVKPKATPVLDPSKMPYDEYVAARKAGKLR